MVAVSKLAIFKNVRESVALGLDFYLNKNNFKQGAFKGRISAGTRPLRTFNVLLASLLLSRLEKEKIRIAKDALFELSEPRSSRRPGDQGPASAFRQLRDVFEDDLEPQGYVMVFGDRLSFDLELENGVLRYIPQDQYLQTGSAIGIARDREPPPLPKTT